MSPSNFAIIRECPNKEAGCHIVFDEVHTKWTIEGRDAINETQLTVLCVETYFGEVCNGGLDQYLGNESGRNASFGPAALRRVGLTNYATILEDALKHCTNSQDENEFGISEDYFVSLESADEDHDKQFFKLYFADKTEFRDKLHRFILDNEADFLTTS